MTQSRKPLLAMLFPALVLLLSQPDMPGFISGHHGWISSHSLANAVHTTPRNYLTGYTLQVLDAEGRPEPVYFNRSPLVGTVLMGAPLHVVSSLRWQVRVSRALNTLVVGAALALVLRILLDAGLALPLALAAVCLAGCGHYLATYRDMISVDVWTLLSMAMVARAAQPVGPSKLRPRWRWWLAGACSVGWGYSALVPVALWAVADGVLTALKTREHGLSAALRAAVRARGVAALLVATALLGAYLTHTTIAEAAVRGVPVTESGVWESARRRIGLDDGFNAKTAPIRADRRKVLARRLGWSLLPRQAHGFLGPAGDPLHQPRWLILLLLSCLAAAAFIATRAPGQRLPVGLLAAGGTGWYLAMPNLSLHHDYVAMSNLGLTAVSAAGLLAPLGRIGPNVQRATAAIGAALLLWVHAEYRETKLPAAAASAVVTADFQAIRGALPAGAPVHYVGGYRSITGEAPYKVGFYLPDHAVASKPEQAAFHITRGQPRAGTSLTPANKRVFLARVSGRPVTSQ